MQHTADLRPAGYDAEHSSRLNRAHLELSAAAACGPTDLARFLGAVFLAGAALSNAARFLSRLEQAGDPMAAATLHDVMTAARLLIDIRARYETEVER